MISAALRRLLCLAGIHDPIDAVPAEVVPNPGSVCHDFSRFLESPLSADVVFVVEGQRFHAHRVILAASVRTDVFAALFERSGASMLEASPTHPRPARAPSPPPAVSHRLSCGAGEIPSTELPEIELPEMKAEVFRYVLREVYGASDDNEGVEGGGAREQSAGGYCAEQAVAMGREMAKAALEREGDALSKAAARRLSSTAAVAAAVDKVCATSAAKRRYRSSVGGVRRPIQENLLLGVMLAADRFLLDSLRMRCARQLVRGLSRSTVWPLISELPQILSPGDPGATAVAHGCAVFLLDQFRSPECSTAMSSSGRASMSSQGEWEQMLGPRLAAGSSWVEAVAQIERTVTHALTHAQHELLAGRPPRPSPRRQGFK